MRRVQRRGVPNTHAVSAHVLSRCVAATVALAAVISLAQLAVTDPARAATTGGWASWGPLAGSSNAFTTTMRLPAGGFPRATVASNSRGPARIPGGTSTFLGGSGDSVATPVGQKYGSSRGNAYLNLRPEADTATAPSTTTYTFDDPTPGAGWTFVVGDIDSDKVQIHAKDADGTTLTPARIAPWFRGTFNYAGGSDRPSWNPLDSTLTGNTQAADTEGASAWFEPDVALSQLTFVYTRRAGFPVFQTWFASQANSIGAAIADASIGSSCPLEQSTVVLTSPTGRRLASGHPDSSGNFDFGRYALQAGYTVAVEPPDGCAVVGDPQVPLSTLVGDATALLRLRAVVPQAVSGKVTTGDGTPVAGAEITLTPPGGGAPRTITTDVDGTYLIDDNGSGSGYTIALTDVPPGFAATGTTSHTFDIAAAAITGQDFGVRELPSVAGDVSGGSAGVGGVTVTLTSTGGSSVTTTTDGHGHYTFDHVPSGTYELSVTPPPGYRGTLSRDGVDVATADVTGQDFNLSRPGAIGGTVANTATRHPVSGVAVTIEGPGGRTTVHTDGAGNYFVDRLAAGSYTVSVQVPDNFRAAGRTTRTVHISNAGEIRSGQDFGLAASAASSSAPSTASSTSDIPVSAAPPSGTSGPSSAAASLATGATGLAGTGAPTVLVVPASALLALGALLLVAVRRRRTPHAPHHHHHHR